ncbi:MAG: enoyl-CoA hydratase/isomerase family protein [Phycisphaerales bacterium]|nr:MAG: enoyl-CoA hydratase/isomerase family protein [Phycisphaerales bacterium]
MAGNSQTILLQNCESVRTITLNRPNVLNAFNEELATALVEALRDAGQDESVRCLMITGAGRAFCSGQDLVEYADRLDGDKPIELEERLRDKYNPIILAIRTMEKPVLASVNGVAAGAGCSLALACDLRIASASASFIEAFINIGVVPDCGSTFMLPRLVGVSRAMELSFTGRRVLAQEALQIGLVNQVVADDELPGEAMNLAQKLASLPTRAIGMTKQAINTSWTADLDAQIELEARLQTPATRTQDHREGVHAFVEKRPPKFRGR